MTFEENDSIDLIAPQIKTLTKQIMEKIASKKKNKDESIKMMLGLKSLLSQIAEKSNELSNDNNQEDTNDSIIKDEKSADNKINDQITNDNIVKEEVKNDSLYHEYGEN
jgi:hypothetical protein